MYYVLRICKAINRGKYVQQITADLGVVFMTHGSTFKIHLIFK